MRFLLVIRTGRPEIHMLLGQKFSSAKGRQDPFSVRGRTSAVWVLSKARRVPLTTFPGELAGDTWEPGPTRAADGRGHLWAGFREPRG